MDKEIIQIKLEDELDLHHFHPKDAIEILKEFIDSEYINGKKEIRIAHGKGKSVLKNIVLNELEKNEKIISFRNDGANWGATIAVLKRK
ncbi:MAG: Smr/MutS family protein [Spirochaetes bacterium]|nr:Smr/MutS family protein [Spirochaetota bacterium]